MFNRKKHEGDFHTHRTKAAYLQTWHASVDSGGSKPSAYYCTSDGGDYYPDTKDTFYSAIVFIPQVRTDLPGKIYIIYTDKRQAPRTQHGATP